MVRDVAKCPALSFCGAYVVERCGGVYEYSIKEAADFDILYIFAAVY